MIENTVIPVFPEDDPASPLFLVISFPDDPNQPAIVDESMFKTMSFTELDDNFALPPGTYGSLPPERQIHFYGH